MVGRGAYGKVLLVRLRGTERRFAMKVIEKSLLAKPSFVAYMKTERDVMARLNHPFLVRLSMAFQSRERLFLVMPFLKGGELFTRLRRAGLLMEAAVRIYAAEMILAIEHLHEHGIIHRDLKPENILLDDEGHICITDYGLCKVLPGGNKKKDRDSGEGGRAGAGTGTGEGSIVDAIKMQVALPSGADALHGSA